MSDRTEEEEERWIRRVARRMPVHPERLLDRLRPLGFVLIFANRDAGLNEIDLLRPAPGLPGLFDIIHVKADIYGGGASVGIYQSIVPFGHTSPCAVSWHVPASRFGYSNDHADVRGVAQAKEFECRVADAALDLFSELHQREGEILYRETASAREAAARYLVALQPDCSLVDTWNRLRASAATDQREQAQRYVRNECLCSFNLENDRIVWEIAGLCQVLYWERHGIQFRGLGGETNYRRANENDIEAHRRFQIVASRLARSPGWPAVDPLVPSRCDSEEFVTWREGKPSRVAESFDDYMATAGHRCVCGKMLYYVKHAVRGVGGPVAEVLTRCNNGHEEVVEIADSPSAFDGSM